MSFFGFFSGNKKGGEDKMPETWENTSLDRAISDQADAFLEKYNARYQGLDYSERSLKVLEILLSDAYGFYNEMTPEQQQKIVEGAGSYLFEVARRTIGGVYYWHQKTTQPILVTGQPKFETAILAFNQVKNRLKNGVDDHIPTYFESYKQNVYLQRSAIIL